MSAAGGLCLRVSRRARDACSGRGAAFPFLAGFVPQAPQWMQDRGLEWLFRLVSEPRRLWRRYLYLNPAYALLVALQMLGVSRFPTNGQAPRSELLYG
jgi:N-acetylglucosaminyldiphosphoundecaprenol N-acetyl-beta-D-mannosaminyltransferase